MLPLQQPIAITNSIYYACHVLNSFLYRILRHKPQYIWCVLIFRFRYALYIHVHVFCIYKKEPSWQLHYINNHDVSFLYMYRRSKAPPIYGSSIHCLISDTYGFQNIVPSAGTCRDATWEYPWCPVSSINLQCHDHPSHSRRAGCVQGTSSIQGHAGQSSECRSHVWVHLLIHRNTSIELVIRLFGSEIHWICRMGRWV